MQQVPYSDSGMDDMSLIVPSMPSIGGSAAFPSSLPTILCCLCGTRIQSNPANMCINCLKSQVDITAGITKQLTVFFCRNCSRYQRPPWVHLDLESREMLAFCLKKVKGLGKDVRLVDAGFVWTEPHSKRIKVKLTVQKEVFSGALLQQSFIVEFIVAGQQCTDCQKSFTEHTWTAVVQVRQKVQHKKTMLMLEQLLLKHNVVARAMGVKEQGDGLDFYWHTRGGANHLLDFLRGCVPIRSKQSKRLISQDDKSNTFNYKYTLYTEVAPICKDDLVILPSQLASLLGLSASSSAALYIVTRVTSNLTLLDPVHMQLVEVSGGTYWHYPFRALMTAKQLTEYMIIGKETLDATPVSKARGGGGSIGVSSGGGGGGGGKDDKKRQRDASVDGRGFSKTNLPQYNKLSAARFTLMKVSEIGVVDTTYECVSHLGYLLNEGDHCLGYDLNNANIEEDDAMTSNRRASSRLRSDVDVLLVKKSYEKKHRAKKRKFTIKTLVKEDADSNAGKGGRRGDERRNDVDMEDFLQELEEDRELAGKVNLYKRRDAEVKKTSGGGRGMVDEGEAEGEDGEDGEEGPEVDMDALLEEMGSMQVSVGGAAALDGAESEAESEGGEFETDWDVGTGDGGSKKAGGGGGAQQKRNRK